MYSLCLHSFALKYFFVCCLTAYFKAASILLKTLLWPHAPPFPPAPGSWQARPAPRPRKKKNKNKKNLLYVSKKILIKKPTQEKEGDQDDESLNPKRTNQETKQVCSGNKNLDANMIAIFRVLKGQGVSLFCIPLEKEHRIHYGHYPKSCQILELDKERTSQIGEFFVTRSVQVELK